MNRTLKFLGFDTTHQGSNQMLPVFEYKKYAPTKIKYVKVNDTFVVNDDQYKKFLDKNNQLKSFVSVEGLTSGTMLALNGQLTTGSNNLTGTLATETATVAGTITAAGNITVTITGTKFVGPLAIPVAVANTDTATIVAGKIIAVLKNTKAVTDFYGVGGTGVTVKLTSLTTASNDGTLNIALATGTATGLTAAATSAAGTADGFTYTFAPAQANNSYEVVIDSTQYVVSSKTNTVFTLDLIMNGNPAATVNFAILK